jgi:hypothetical protein
MLAAAVEPTPSGVREPTREVFAGDGDTWLRRAKNLSPTHAIVTSLPDVSEMPSFQRVEGWEMWAVGMTMGICEAVADTAVAVFYQGDVRREGRWIDKSYLVSRGAAEKDMACLFHKIVCRVPGGTVSRGRSGYAHLLGFSRKLRLPDDRPSRDVIPQQGRMPWARAMGTAVCEDVCEFLLRWTECRVVVDLFCGMGTMLAVANAYGLDAIGVEMNRARAERAARLRFHKGIGLR